MQTGQTLRLSQVGLQPEYTFRLSHLRVANRDTHTGYHRSVLQPGYTLKLSQVGCNLDTHSGYHRFGLPTEIHTQAITDPGCNLDTHSGYHISGLQPGYTFMLSQARVANRDTHRLPHVRFAIRDTYTGNDRSRGMPILAHNEK